MNSKKRKKLKNRELEIATENEKKMQENRIKYNDNIIPAPIVQVPLKSVYKNIDFYEKLLKNNLTKIGFNYNLINGIIPILSLDEIMKINANWKHFEIDILKKFDIRIILMIILIYI